MPDYTRLSQQREDRERRTDEVSWARDAEGRAMSDAPQQAATPTLKDLFRRFTNAHFATCADEYREGASDAAVKRRYDASLAAESAFWEAVEALLAERDLMRMQAAAVMTASFQNTETSIKDRIGRENPYWTQCYGDVCAAVDREMGWRKQVAERNDNPQMEMLPANLEEMCASRDYWRDRWNQQSAERDALVKERDGLLTELKRWCLSDETWRVLHMDTRPATDTVYGWSVEKWRETRAIVLSVRDAARSSGGKGATP